MKRLAGSRRMTRSPSRESRLNPSKESPAGELYSPTLPTDRGHWIRRTVSVPPNLVVGAYFEVLLPLGSTGAAGPGWFVDDIAVLTQEDCAGAIDTNADGRVGCADPTCKGAVGCIETTCTGGLDDDGDGFTDCEDEACAGAVECVD